MGSVEKLVLAAGVGRNLYGRWRFRRLLAVVAMVGILAMTAAILLSALVIGGLYAIYVFLLSQGAQFLTALLIAALLAVLLALSLFAMVLHTLRKLRASAATPIQEAADAFLDGLLSNSRH